MKTTENEGDSDQAKIEKSTENSAAAPSAVNGVHKTFLSWLNK